MLIVSIVLFTIFVNVAVSHWGNSGRRSSWGKPKQSSWGSNANYPPQTTHPVARTIYRFYLNSRTVNQQQWNAWKSHVDRESGRVTASFKEHSQTINWVTTITKYGTESCASNQQFVFDGRACDNSCTNFNQCAGRTETKYGCICSSGYMRVNGEYSKCVSQSQCYLYVKPQEKWTLNGKDCSESEWNTWKTSTEKRSGQTTVKVWEKKQITDYIQTIIHHAEETCGTGEVFVRNTGYCDKHCSNFDAACTRGSGYGCGCAEGHYRAGGVFSQCVARNECHKYVQPTPAYYLNGVVVTKEVYFTWKERFEAERGDYVVGKVWSHKKITDDIEEIIFEGQETCVANQKFLTNQRRSQNTCGNQNIGGTEATSGCVCNNGYTRLHNGWSRCVKSEKCNDYLHGIEIYEINDKKVTKDVWNNWKSDVNQAQGIQAHFKQHQSVVDELKTTTYQGWETCGSNQIFKSSVKVCDNTCANKHMCSNSVSAGCICANGYVRIDSKYSRCVEQNKCDAYLHGIEVYLINNQKVTKEVFESWKEYFMQGKSHFSGSIKRNQQTQDSITTTTTSGFQTCQYNQVFVLDNLKCDNTCANKNFCGSVRQLKGSGCKCNQGYVRINGEYSECVQESQCKSETHWTEKTTPQTTQISGGDNSGWNTGAWNARNNVKTNLRKSQFKNNNNNTFFMVAIIAVAVVSLSAIIITACCLFKPQKKLIANSNPARQILV